MKKIPFAWVPDDWFNGSIMRHRPLTSAEFDYASKHGCGPHDHEFRDWIIVNCRNDYALECGFILSIGAYFADYYDAIMFKLRWS